MKKLTLSILLLVASTLASAQVEISGKIGMYYDNTQKAGVRTTGVAQENTNNITFRAKEDLGGGLTARVVIDTKLNANDPKSADSQIGDRESTVGLANKFASVDMGRSYHSAFNTLRKTDVLGNLYGSIASDVHTARDNRFSNGVFLKATPTSNLGVSYDRVQSTTPGLEGVSYGAKLEVAGVLLDVSRWELGGDKTNIYGAVTDIYGYRVSALHSEDTTSGTTTRGTSVGVKKQLWSTPWSLAGTYGEKYGNEATDLKAYNVSLEYAFSKRTNAHVVYRNVDAKVATLDTKQIGFGLIHRF